MKTKMLFILVLSIVGLEASVNRGPILSSERPSEAMFVNFTTENSCIAEARFRELPSGTWLSVSDEVATTSHHLSMSIHPGREHEYILLADGDSLGPYSFWTAPRTGARQDFHFCAYGDTRTGIIAHWVIVDHVMTCDPMFMIHSGDMIEDGHDHGQWDDYFTELCEWHDIAQSVPYFYAMGNHDDESPYFYDALRLPRNNPDSVEAYSSFDWGRIHFFSMNSEVAYDSTSPQYVFLESDLASATADPNYDFVVGTVHRPFYSSGYHGREEAMADFLEPLLIEYGVDLVFQGHDHMYERVAPQDGVNYIVTGGGGAPPSPVVLWHDYTAFGYNLYHHLDCHYDSDEAKLSIYMHNYSNIIVDSLILHSTAVDVAERAIPKDVSISARPNPFNSCCVFESPSSREIFIHDISGRLVAKGTGPVFRWKPKENVSSGLYFAGSDDSYNDFSKTARVVYLK